MTELIESEPCWRDHPLIKVVAWLERQSATHAANSVFRCRIPNPDWGIGCYPGELYERDGRLLRHRSLPLWYELAELVGCRLLTPRWLADEWLLLTFQVLDPQKAPHRFEGPRAEKYEPGTLFSKVVRTEEPTFLREYLRFIRRLPERTGCRVLILGVGQGWEFEPFYAEWPAERLAETEMIGLDHAVAALEAARRRFGSGGPRFVATDLADCDWREFGRFDVLIAVNVLHSPAIDGHGLLQRLIKDHCTPNCRVLFGFPNCRYLDGEVRYGTRVGRQKESDWAPLLQEVAYYRRILEKNGFNVQVRGKHTVIVQGARKQFKR